MAIPDTTRRDIILTFKVEDISWSGRLDDVDFLSRIYDLDKMPSSDHRFRSAKNDIWQHRINNHDWDDDWIFYDRRFDLLHCPDDKFLRFLCEIIHPLVRPNRAEAGNLLEHFNEELRPVGYQIVEKETRFGNIRYEPKGILPTTVDSLEQLRDVADQLTSEYLQHQIVRMTTAIETDPELAIGSAKEFVESICKMILKDRNKTPKGGEKLPNLVYLTIEAVKPMDTSQSNMDTAELIRKTLGALSTLTQCIAELRNLQGTGHGKDVDKLLVEPRHAALAVNAAATIALYLYQSHEKSE